MLMADLLKPVEHLCISQRRQLKNGAPLLQHNGGKRTINNYWLLIILAEGQSDRVYLPSGGTAVRSQTTDLMSQGLFEVSDRSDITRTVVPALVVAATTAKVGLCSEFTTRYLCDVHAYKNDSKPRTTSSKSAVLNSYKSNCLLLLSLFTTAETFLEARGTFCSTKSSGPKFHSPVPEVMWRTVTIIIRVVLLSPYLCIRGVSLSSIHYNQSRLVYINQRHQYICFIWS